jgi:hypothetical protein
MILDVNIKNILCLYYNEFLLKSGKGGICISQNTTQTSE